MSNDRLVADTLKQIQNSGCADIIGNVRPSPLLVTKEHYWMNFTTYHLPHPTYVAIVRDPVDIFASNFYQCRFGDQGRPDYKGTNCKYMTKERLEMTIDDSSVLKQKNRTIFWNLYFSTITFVVC